MEEEGDGILKRVAAEHPELIFAAMVKLVSVMRLEVGSPGDPFSKLESKQAIIAKLEERQPKRGGKCRAVPLRLRHLGQPRACIRCVEKITGRPGPFDRRRSAGVGPLFGK